MTETAQATLRERMHSRFGDLAPQPFFAWRIAALGCGALAGSMLLVAICERSGLDLAVSDLFYDRTANRWLVDFHRDHALRHVVYTAPKVLAVCLSIGLIAAMLGPDAWRRGIPRRAFACALSFWLFSLTVSAMKDRTDIYFPRQIERYQPAGNMPPPGVWQAPDKPMLRIPYRRLFEAYPTPRPDGIKTGRGFPGAHATAGFWLMGLAVLCASASGRRRWLLVGSLAGWALGLYQTVNGNHFLSHTLMSWGIGGFFLAMLWMAWGPWRVEAPAGTSLTPRACASGSH